MASKKSRAQAMWRSPSGSSSVQTALMTTLCVASRWLKAVASSGTRPSAPPSWRMMVYERGDVIREVWSMSVSIAPSVSGGSSTDFQ